LSSFKRCFSQPARASTARSSGLSSFRPLTSFQQAKEGAQLVAQLGAGHDGVEVPEFQVALGAAEAGGQGLARGLLDHARP
jgi:hypothetical protein